MRAKSLHLRRETLIELAEVQLENVAGGATAHTCTCTTCSGCFSVYQCELPPLPSVPLRDCPFS